MCWFGFPGGGGVERDRVNVALLGGCGCGCRCRCGCGCRCMNGCGGGYDCGCGGVDVDTELVGVVGVRI